MCSSEDVAIWTSSQLTVDMKDSSAAECSWSSVHMPAVGPSCMPS